MKRNGIVIVVVTLIIGILASYALMYARSVSLVRDYLTSAGYQSAELNGVKVYADGIVIDKIMLEPNKFLEKIYIQANPFQQILHAPEFVSVAKADLTIESFFQDKIGFITDIPFVVETVNIRTVFLSEPMDLSLRIKQNTSSDAGIYFKGKGNHARIQGRGEIHFDTNLIQSVNLDFSKINLSFDQLKTKRSDGWISLVYKNEWLISAELGAGYADMAGLQSHDAVLNVTGTVKNPTWNMTGIDNKTNETLALSGSNGTIGLSFKEHEFAYPATAHIDVKTLQSVQESMRSIKDPPVITVVKTRPAVPRQKTINVEKKPIDSLQIVEAVKRPFAYLIKTSLFQGLRYTNDLTVIDLSCLNKNCWTARARGGVLDYNPTDLPTYFTRMKDYAASDALRHVLQGLKIKTLTLNGTDNRVTDLIVNGITPDAQPVYIELSVSDVD